MYCVGTVCFVGTPSTDPETRLYPLPVQKVEIGTEVTLLSLKKKLIMYVYSDILPSNWIMYTIISVFKLKLQWVNLTCFKKAWYHLNRRKNSYKMVLVKKNRIGQSDTLTLTWSGMHSLTSEQIILLVRKKIGFFYYRLSKILLQKLKQCILAYCTLKISHLSSNRRYFLWYAMKGTTIWSLKYTQINQNYLTAYSSCWAVLIRPKLPLNVLASL